MSSGCSSGALQDEDYDEEHWDEDDDDDDEDGDEEEGEELDGEDGMDYGALEDAGMACPCPTSYPLAHGTLFFWSVNFSLLFT